MDAFCWKRCHRSACLTMTKVLILTLGWNREPFTNLLQAQQETWDSYSWPHVISYFYREARADSLNENVLNLACDDSYGWLPWLLKRALDAVWEKPWDIVFRTNASSYVCKRKLSEYIQNLPQDKLYHGLVGTVYSLAFAVGEGVFMSRDVADILRNNTPCENSSEIEDQRIGRVIQSHGVKLTPGALRWDYYHPVSITVADTFHYRCKPDQDWQTKDPHRTRDIAAMKILADFKRLSYI